MFNKIDENFDDVVIRTFKVGLLTEQDLRKSLTRKLVRSVRQLMDRIEEYKRVKEDQQQGKGKVKVALRTEGISSRTGIITVDLEEVLQSTLDQLLLK